MLLQAPPILLLFTKNSRSHKLRRVLPIMAPAQNQIVVGTTRGDTTINVQKLLDQPWYKYKHLRNLYGWLCVVLIVQATNGLDGSIMNGMQTLTYWVSLSCQNQA